MTETQLHIVFITSGSLFISAGTFYHWSLWGLNQPLVVARGTAVFAPGALLHLSSISVRPLPLSFSQVSLFRGRKPHSSVKEASRLGAVRQRSGLTSANFSFFKETKRTHCCAKSLRHLDKKQTSERAA